MFVRPKMLRVGHVLPKIPRQIPIICRHKPKTKGHARKMGEKGAKEKKRIQRINRLPKKYFFIFIIFFIISILLFFITDFLYFFVIFYYFIFFLLPIYY